jgi:hypothetical protein
MERNSPYGDSPLLSEIHTLFPALLYDHARFHNIQDVFRYVRERLRARYDIFSNATREFQHNDSAFLNRIINTEPLTTSRIPVVSMNIVESIGQIAVSDIIRSFLYGPGGSAAENTYQTGLSGPNSAVYTPSNIQIERATQQFSQVETSNDPCAVCQDSIMQNDIVRKLNGCQHVFHDNCITTWFQRSPLCPMCRYNIVSGNTGPSGAPGPT